MNAMVLISEEVRSNLLGRRVSGGGNREVRVSQVGDGVPGNGIGEIRVSPLSSENQDDMEQQRVIFSYNSPDLEGSETSGEWRTWMHGFETGDMVWGKVKSHPWWPGHIFNEAFASSSVRKTKREGHVLVAFFGDSSYGWFEPAELVPFDSHFAEKSKQTTSRNFLKAVEEAMDEVSRRRALGLSCCCRDPSSFRPTSVPGYVAVDVIGHEPNLIYSWKEIKAARDAFVPGEVVDSLGQLALAPCEVEHGTIEFAKTFAILSALRKAMFEEFDETYAQAFGVEPVRPSPDARVKDQLPVSSRAAPLSGPLVVAEALGSKRGGGLSRSRASKEQAKKNKYLFKRRDDAPAPPPFRFVDLSPSRRSSPPAAEADDGFVLQKRAPPDEPLVAGAIPEVPAIELEPPPVDAPSALEEGKVNLEKEGDAEEEKKPVKSPSPVPGSDSGPSPYPSSGPIPVVPLVEEIDVKAVSIPVTGDADVPHRKHPDATVSGTVVRKVKKLPLPDGEAPERRRKRKKIEGVGSPSADQTAVTKHPKLSDEPKVRKRPVGRPPGAAHSSERGDRGATVTYTPITLPKIELTPQDLEFPLLINDLAMLALDPYHGMERNASLIVRHVFLRFRSLVYQKSLVSPSVGESEAEILSVKPEIAAVMSSPEPVPSQVEVQERQEPVTASQQEPAGVGKQVPFNVSQQERATVLKQEPAVVSKPQALPKPVFKAAARGPNDRMRADRKRPPSDRQEEMTIKREKKLKQLKALASEKKKAGGIFQKMQVADAHKAADRKDGDAKPTSSKISKTEKKPETRILSPTYLFMKFPPGTTLPSIASQKVKFGRFGPLDLSAFRVYWKSYTCKMLFKYKADAQNAFLYASNNDMFGQIKVIYSLREFEAPASEPVEPEKQPVEAHADDVQSKLGRNDEPANDPRLSAQRIQQQQSLQLKSCLKKPSGDEPGALGTGTGGLTKESPRVKFMLVGDDGVREPPPVAPGNGGNGDAILPLPPVDSQIKIPRPVNPLPPLLPLPPRHSSMLPRPQLPLPPPPPPPVAVSYDHGAPQSVRAPTYNVQPPERRENRNIDISNQMINLLLRCRDLVNNVNSAAGYTIYHPL